jgi:hypothetical protein
MIASTGSKIVSIPQIPFSLIMSRIKALIASTASDDCKRLQLRKQLFATCFGLPINLAISPAPRWVIEPRK